MSTDESRARVAQRILDKLKEGISDDTELRVFESTVGEIVQVVGISRGEVLQFLEHNNIKIVSEEQARKDEAAHGVSSSAAVCTRWHGEVLELPNAKISDCVWCGHAVQHSPHLPDWLDKVCSECFADRLDQPEDH